VPSTSALTLAGGDSRTLDLRNIVRGMELFEGPERWVRNDAWYTRKGGGFALYTSRPVGKFVFTVRPARSRNPFAGDWRLKWVAGFVDPRNYLLLQLDDKHYYRNEVVNGQNQAVQRVTHDGLDGARLVHVSVEMGTNQIVVQFSRNGKDWRVLESWTRTAPRSLADGRFGFHLPGDDEIRVSNFRFYPAAER
jgi:hypothetical protein